MSGKTIRSSIVGVSLALVASTPVFAVTWTQVGTSGFTAVTAQDWKRLRLNYLIEDGAGNLYATAPNGNNNGVAGGLTIYQPVGDGTYTQVDVDVNAAGYRGEVTKMVVAGDGYVYALQNWLEINWPGWDAGIDHRILRVAPNGTLTSMVTFPADPNNGDTRPTDMTVGSDGNIYVTRDGGSNTYKYQYLWRLRLFGAGAPVFEVTPQTSYNHGRSETHTFYDLFYVGTTNGIDSFSIWSRQSDPKAWEVSGMGWDRINSDATNYNYYRRFATLGSCNPGWGRSERVTAAAFDPVRKTLWYGGLGAGANCFWTGIGQTMTAMDMGGGNFALKSQRTGTGTAGWKSRFYNGAGYGEVTAAASLKVDAYSAGYNGYFLTTCASPWSAAGGGDSNTVVGIRIANVSGVDNFVLWNVGSTNLPINTQLAVLGPVDTNFHEFRIYSNSTGTDKVTCWYDGVQMFDGPVTVNTSPPTTNIYDGALVSVGAAATLSPATAGATATVTVDWLAGTIGLYNGPATSWPWMAGAGNEFNFADGSVLPSDSLSTHIMTRFTGNPSLPSLFDQVGVPSVNPEPIPGVASCTSWHANGNDPGSTHITNGSLYWVSSLAINPCTGSAWMAWSADTNNGGQAGVNTFYNNNSNTFAPLGQYVTMGAADAGPTSTVNGPGSLGTTQIVGTHFSPLSNKVFCLTFDLTDGKYRLYSAPNPDASLCCPIPWADSDADGDVDMTDFGKWQACFTESTGQFNEAGCKCFDRDYDRKVNAADLFKFQDCALGAGVPAAVDCGN